MTRFNWILFLTAGLATGCASAVAPSAKTSGGLNGGCAQTIVRVERLDWHGESGAPSTALPVVGIDLVDVPSADRTVLSVAPCNEPPQSTSEVTGSASFVVDGAWLSGAVTASCVRLTATAYHGDARVGSGTLTLRRGDFTVSGTVSSQPSGQPKPSAEPFARVSALVGAQRFATIADEKGQFTLDNLPGGKLFLVTAHSSPVAGGVLRTGQATPRTTLSNTHPQVTVALMLHDRVDAGDAFEPDGTISLAGKRALLAVNSSEAHTLAAADLDLAPFSAQAGHTYVATASPRGSGPADLALAVLRADGSVIAHANDPTGAFARAPSLSFKAAASGQLYVRVGRNDAESTVVAYDLSLKSTTNQ
jgi:hypothetical protein